MADTLSVKMGYVASPPVEGATYTVMLQEDGSLVATVSAKTADEATRILLEWKNGRYQLLSE